LDSLFYHIPARLPNHDDGGYYGDQEHEEIMEWLGGSFDPEAFDMAKINAALRKLKWPRTSEAYLARALM